MRTERGRVASELLPRVDHLVQVQVDADLRHGVGRNAVDDIDLPDAHMLTAEVVVQLNELGLVLNTDSEEGHRMIILYQLQKYFYFDAFVFNTMS